MYKNSCSADTQSGCLSDFVKLGRDCRQRVLISPNLFNVCAEGNNKHINGIRIDNVEFNILQYTDCASVSFDGSKASQEQILQVLETLADILGLKPFFERTQVVWIGAKKKH